MYGDPVTGSGSPAARQLRGTQLYAPTNRGRGVNADKRSCGIGVVINGGDRAQYRYRRGDPSSLAVTTGDRVTGGQYLMYRGSTDNSTGPQPLLAAPCV